MREGESVRRWQRREWSSEERAWSDVRAALKPGRERNQTLWCALRRASRRKAAAVDVCLHRGW